MQELSEWLDRILTVVFVPATAYGATGAALRCIRAGVGKRRLIIEVIGGAIATNALMPIIAEYTPQSWHYTLCLGVGLAGIEGISRFYEAVASAVENRIKRRISGE